MKKLLFILLNTGIAVSGVKGQQLSVHILDKNTGEPVENAMALVSSNASNNTVFISDAEGLISFDIAPPFDVLLTHLNYHDHKVRIEDSNVTSINLLPKNIVLDDIVVTGQYQPQSASNSVYTVRTVDKETIENMGATQLTDILAKQLNIRISPDVAIGSSSMQIQGIDGKNLKILIDGVPLVNRNGNGNDADLSQINMANIERIEIVEGPMAVNYGANALAGVINLITKKVEKGSYRVGIELQGETVDNAYSFNDGISNLNFTSGVTLPKSLLFSLNGGSYRFGGYDLDEDVRGYFWNPKTQYFYDASLTYTKNNLSISYKFDDFFEEINDEDSVHYEEQASTGSIRPYGIDAEYKSHRTSHQLQAHGQIGKLTRFTFMASYSDFERKKRTFKNYLDSSEEIDQSSSGSSDTTQYSTLVSRGSVQSINPNAIFNYQAGYEINLESTSGGRIKDGEEQFMIDYALFATAEITPLSGLKLRPGLRWSNNSSFGSNVSPALNIKYSVSSSFSINAAYGRGYRAPSLRELYFEFIDSNHQIYGNEDLQPEFSNHYDIGATHKWSNNTIGLKSHITLFYNDIQNLIGYQFDETNATYAKYFNLSSLKTTGVNLNETFMWGHLTLGVGFGITGRKELDAELPSPDNFLFSPDVSLDFNYLERKTEINFNIFYKYNGSYSQYLFDSNDEAYIAKTDPYNLLDITLSRKIVKSLSATLGAKNLLNVTNVNTTASGGSIHGSSSSSSSIGYGRSYFLKLALNINSNK